MGSSDYGVIAFSSEDLNACTNNFNDDNQIGLTQFGKLYRGRLKPPGFLGTQGRDVTVKIWDEKADSMACVHDHDHYLMVKEEVQFLRNPAVNSHPNLVKLMGYCCDKELRGVVYDLNPRDTLHNLILKDDMSWIERVNVILQLAGLLEFLHRQNKPYMVLNINASHVMLDPDCKPKLCDFGFISGRIINEMDALKKPMPLSIIGYADPSFAAKGGYRQSSSCDVFGFGVLLLGLISKRPFDDPDKLDNMIQYWAKNEYKPNCSLVHKSLREDWDYHVQDGIAITELGIRCIEFFTVNRPTMKLVVERLQALLVLQRPGDERSIKRKKNFHETLY